MKIFYRLIYKLGRLSSNLPKPSTKPIVKIKDAFLAGRHDAKVVKTQQQWSKSSS